VGVHNGLCWFHRGQPRSQRSPKRRKVVDLFPEEAPLPSLVRDRKLIPKLRSWAEEFDALAPEHYPATEFIRWLELEVAPPSKPLEAQPVYSVIGEAAAALR
jgi:hypothetical protein